VTHARLLSFVLLWLFAWAVYLANDKLRGVHPQASITYYFFVGLSGHDPRLDSLRRSHARLRRPRTSPPSSSSQQLELASCGFFFWPALLLIPAAVAHLAHQPLAWPQSRDTVWLSAAYAGIFFLNNFLFTAALEEPGWRRFLLPRLQQHFSPLVASLLVWFPWALWHAPLDFHRPFRFALVDYLLIRVVFLIPITILLTWFYNRSNSNPLTTVSFHASMNTFPFVLPYYQPAFALVILFAVAVIFTDHIWRRIPCVSPHLL
jgi:membrane protease YdiL (CAAX protease family)